MLGWSLGPLGACFLSATELPSYPGFASATTVIKLRPSHLSAETVIDNAGQRQTSRQMGLCPLTKKVVQAGAAHLPALPSIARFRISPDRIIPELGIERKEQLGSRVANGVFFLSGFTKSQAVWCGKVTQRSKHAMLWARGPGYYCRSHTTTGETPGFSSVLSLASLCRSSAWQERPILKILATT